MSQASRGRTGIPVDQWNQLVLAFRDRPGAYTHAATRAGVHVRTARKAWESGWPGLGVRPIQALVAEEMAAARRLVQIEGEREQRRQRGALSPDGVVGVEEERRAAAQHRARDAQLARGARDGTLALMATVQSLLRGVAKRGEEMRLALESAQMTPKQYVELTRSIARVHALSVRAGREAMEIERLRLGLPRPGDASPDGGVRDAATALAAFDRLRSVVERAHQLGLTEAVAAAVEDVSKPRPSN